MHARSAEDKRQLYKDVCQQIEDLETQADTRIKDMKNNLKRTIESIANSIYVVNVVFPFCIQRETI